MEEAFWAARQGDALLHTSFMADVLGAVLEVAANVVIDALIVGTTSLLAASVGFTMGCTAVVLTGFVAGVAMVYTGVTEKVSEACSALADMLFPPQIEGYILTGSGDTWINSKPAARAAATAASRQDIEAQEAQSKAEQEEAQRQEDARTFRDVAGEYLEMAGAIALAVNPVTGPVLMSRALHDQLSTEEGRSEMVDGVTHFVSELWQPTVASAAPGSTPTPDDKIDCHKHPSSLTQFLAQKKAAFLDDPLGTALNLLSPDGMLAQKATRALPHPVNAATGAKYLADDDDFDFSLPGHFPLDWQRVYSSRDERTEGMFGQGWSVMYEVSLVRTPGNADENCMTFVSGMGRRLDMEAVLPGSGFYSPGEGLAVRRGEQGHWLISSDDGQFFLFEADPHNPQRQRLKMLGDRNSNCLNLYYDDRGRITEISGEQQRPCIRLYYELAAHPRRMTQIYQHFPETAPLLLRRYSYDEAGHLNGVYDSTGHLLREFAYDENHCMTLHRQPGGEGYYYQWGWYDGPDDAAWRVTGHHTDSGEQYRLAWDLAQRRLCVTDGLGRTRYHQWDAQNQVTAYQDEAGQVTTFRWSDEERLLLGMTDPQGGKWRYVYDRQGHITETHDPLGRVAQAQWHPVWHQPETEVDAAGNSWRCVYDERGNLLAVTDPLQQNTRYQYDHHGQVVQITDVRGGNKYLQWNEDGQLMRHTDCSGSQTAWFYDERTRLIRMTDAQSHSTRYGYDDSGHLTEVILADGRTVNYQSDAAGRLVKYTSPMGRITRWQRDGQGRVRSRTDAMGRRTAFGYDAYGRLVTLTNENGERYRFRHDVLDRLAEQINPDGCRQSYRYNALNAVTEVVFTGDRGGEIRHRLARDAAGRLTAKETADGRTEYVHDAADRLLEIRRRRSDAGETDAPEIIRFSYDRLGRMLSEETAQGILTHQYDELGNRTATTFPDGRTQRHLYYGSGHLQQINLDREVISEFTRDHLHREVLRSQGRLSTRQLYDPGGRLKRRETYSGMRGVVPETFTDRQYSYSGEDELLKTRHSRRGETDYFYDPTGRITACRSEDEGYLASWQYDAAGNLLGRRAGERATAENSVVPFNRLMSYRGVHYRYDEFGRAVEKEGRSGTQSYRYDAEHRMVEVTTARGTYRYVYDALGRRTEKQHISPDGKPYNRTKFLWDGMRLAQESRPEGTGSLYIYRDQGSYEPLARVDKAGKEGPNRILYFHTDVNGAPEEMTDSDGKIVWETGYQVWGNTIQEKDHGRVEQNLRYQGQYLDRETGLHYNLHRYYDPDVGRFMVTDPIGLLGGLNLYQYAPNPLGWIDPLGLKCGQPEWTNHGYKHFPPKNKSWKDIIKSTKSGPAKYSPDIDIKTLEYDVFNTGTPVTNGKPWKVKDMGKVIGASEGKESQWVRVELSGGTIHGHPISLDEFRRLTTP
ncbi:TPA: RHS repeat-associated core domain-containing protein [Escherichia coli]|uniref:RHS repeat-associated core domain protein n=1 Tax=Escherichia coli 1-250-04_S3_C1 TaxID=1444135 RepID=A0AAN4NWC6_ECOLX|nr:RHS repeat-associated core domain-containing protein [Escherichia coli]EZJ89316.1 RHS repeat-associated core domain protein [Escherichia coli 1-250-04_S3_C1]KEO37416.1 RHS repeat-associated core domain protein [Escherichia coli 1-250-04_S3_C2]MDT9101927.1 RHS repeat-associated core domain-containing protein [Escherichia coli]